MSYCLHNFWVIAYVVLVSPASLTNYTPKNKQLILSRYPVQINDLNAALAMISQGRTSLPE